MQSHIELQISSLRFERNESTVINDLTLRVVSGEVLHIIGANGAGKSTLLHLLAGLLTPQMGAVQLRCDDKLFAPRNAYYRSQLIFIGHREGVKSYLTPLENLRWYRQLHNCAEEREQEILSLLNLQELADTPCNLLSEGQRRKVALARLWLQSACLWLLDEPLTAFDAQTLQLFYDCLAAHRARGGICVLTSHQPLAIGQLTTLQLKDNSLVVDH